MSSSNMFVSPNKQFNSDVGSAGATSTTHVSLGGLEEKSDIAACIPTLLHHLGWNGTRRHIIEALPHFPDEIGCSELLKILSNLNIPAYPKKINLNKLDPRLVPCLYTPKKGVALVILSINGNKATIYNSHEKKILNIDTKGISGTAYLIDKLSDNQSDTQKQSTSDQWFDTISRRFKPLVWQMLGVTAFINTLALSVPLFIMAVYDKVIISSSQLTLTNLVLGVSIAIIADTLLRVMRARMLSFIAGRMDLIIGTAAFRQIIHLPIAMTERASIGSQIARLKQFEGIRDFFTGPLASVFLDLPYTVLYILVIAIVAGPLAWIPLVLITLFALIGAIFHPLLKRSIKSSSSAKSKRQEFLVEMMSQYRAIKLVGAEAIWHGRFRDISAQTAKSNFDSTQISSLIQTLAQFLMMLSGIATLAVGALLVLGGSITLGGLIASMALVWRVLSPLQTGFLSFTKLEQIQTGIHQLNQLMKLELEKKPNSIINRHRRFRGEITFNRVSMRYSSTAEPALLGTEFNIKQGEFVCVTGPNGSGKSTILRLIAGLYKPQSGAIMIDGINIRQLDMGELRNSIAYAPQQCHLFHGTIIQNLQLSEPGASKELILQAIKEVGLEEEIKELSNGLETRITDQLQRQLPAGFKQKLLLARAYIKQANIMLLDEPANNLDWAGDALLLDKINNLRGQTTIVAVTHRPSHMRQADRILYLENGTVVLNGPPGPVMEKLGMGKLGMGKPMPPVNIVSENR
ncbi:peptidase domain-containing ABC transporter [Kiloniella sp. EL199]|uniref:peptidase domain-containing ABC transporter n=1 Tax=Kiloniella sp. EL199 TaxID=2107581 RepID=UPI000EA082BB|nr:ATP-binding cassette domain-containing protein [Kiloniella sp. EL199]